MKIMKGRISISFPLAVCSSPTFDVLGSVISCTPSLVVIPPLFGLWSLSKRLKLCTNIRASFILELLSVYLFVIYLTTLFQ
jgi:hypothetical protein